MMKLLEQRKKPTNLSKINSYLFFSYPIHVTVDHQKVNTKPDQGPFPIFKTFHLSYLVTLKNLETNLQNNIVLSSKVMGRYYH